MANWTDTDLIPKSGLEYWHALDEAEQGGAVVFDYSGNGRYLQIPLEEGGLDLSDEIIAHPLAVRKAHYFDGATDGPLLYADFSGAINLKHFFILAKYDGATFAGNEGLLGDSGLGTNILAGQGAGTGVFFNSSLAGFSYYYNNFPKAQNAQTAPMNEWALIEVIINAGIPMQGLKIGRQNGGSEARWKGWFAESLAFSRVLSETERARVQLYFMLKFGAHNFDSALETNLLELFFPSDDYLDYRRSRFYAEPVDYDRITQSYEFEDGGRTFNESGTPPLRWEYDYLARTPAQALVFDEFWNHARKANTFNFLDKYGTVHENVRIESYNRAHEAHKSWRNDVRFKLVKYP